MVKDQGYGNTWYTEGGVGRVSPTKEEYGKGLARV